MNGIRRRSFLAGLGGLGALAAAPGVLGQDNADSSAPQAVERDEIPRRVLGRTGVSVPIVGLGCGMLGRVGMAQKDATALFQEALNLGMNYLDAAPAYEEAEALLAEVLSTRRDEAFLVTKVQASDTATAEKIFTNSLRRMKTDHVDLLHIHDIGSQNVERILEPGGSLAYLQKMKEQGKARFIGVTGHWDHQSFLPALETGALDVMMTALGFVHKHNYRFEDTVLPVARKHNVGIVAMKVFGGRGAGGLNVAGPAKLASEHIESAFRYSLGIEGVSTAVVGVYTADEIRKNAAMARAYRPLTGREAALLDASGRRLAASWGTYLGTA